MKLKTKQITIRINNKIICHDLNLSIQAGDFWGILGPNGSGKTSLLHTLAGLKEPVSGSIWLNDNNVSNLSPRTIAVHLAILFQDIPLIFPQTVWEYCLTARYPHLPYFKKESEYDKQIVIDALITTDLLALKHQPVTKLSGGEKRRLAIAAALAQTPDIFLLDEPTNHLDIRHQINVLNHFHHLVISESKAVIASLHDMNLAQQFCNRVLLLFSDGHVLQGAPQEIMTIENLNRLYQHPIKKVSGETISLWWPA